MSEDEDSFNIFSDCEEPQMASNNSSGGAMATAVPAEVTSTPASEEGTSNPPASEEGTSTPASEEGTSTPASEEGTSNPPTEETPPLSAEAIDQELPGEGLFEGEDCIVQPKDEEPNYATCLNPEIEAMESTISEILKCPNCTKKFCIDAGDPKDLKCGHTVCGTCLTSTYDYGTNTIECPVTDCKKTHTYTEINKVPTSFTIKQIVTTYLEKKDELANPKTFNKKLKIHPANAELEAEFSITGDAGLCKNHSLPIEFGCTTCEEWLCGTCVCLDHSGFPKTTCKVYPIKTALANKKKQALTDINKKIELFEKLKTDGTDMDVSIQRLVKVMDKESNLLQSIINKFEKKEEIYKKEQEYLKECGGKVSRITSALWAAKTPVQIKEALDIYLENKSFIYKEEEKNDLFEIWKESVYEIDDFWKENDCFYVKWPQMSPNGWAKVSTSTCNRSTLVQFPDKNPETEIKNALIMEIPFFDISSYEHFPFIDINKSERYYVKASFMIYELPLAKLFVERCCDMNYSFKDYRIKFLSNQKILTFGDKSVKNPKKLAKIGDLKQYSKPFNKGAIGIMSKVENGDSIDVNNMCIYMNLMETAPENYKEFKFLSKEDGDETVYMSLCIGEVYENIESLESIDLNTKERMIIVQSGLFVDAEEDDDSDTD